MIDKDINTQIKDLLIKLESEDNQLKFDFGDNMMTTGYGAQPALTISAASVDTISLGSSTLTGAAGSPYNFQYDYTTNLSNSINGGYTITTGGTGGYNQVLTTGTNGLTWSDWGTENTGLKVNGDADFQGDVKIKGKSIAETLEKLEQRLAILHPNEQLEDKWEELKALGDAYRKLEADIIEKQKMWDILKK